MILYASPGSGAAASQCKLLLGTIAQFGLLLRSAGAALWLWGAGICKLLSSHSSVSLAALWGLRCLLPGLIDLGSCIILLASNWSAEKKINIVYIMLRGAEA